MATLQRETPPTEPIPETAEAENSELKTAENDVTAEEAAKAEPMAAERDETVEKAGAESVDSAPQPEVPEPAAATTTGGEHAPIYAAVPAGSLGLDDYLIESLQADSTASDTDRDSTLGSEIPSSSTTSLNSTVTSFRDYCGRRYHAFEESDYWLPNDDEEINRLDLQHFIWRISLSGRLNLAPLPEDLHRALDIGTGTGKWAIEFADAHPSCQVIGTDLSPIQPNVVPENCSFVVDNVEEPWVFNDKFDYIHSRMLVLGIKNWKQYLQNAYDNLKPGGWVECQDAKFPQSSANPNLPPDQPFWRWSQLVAEAMSKSGIDPDPTPKFKRYMEEIGFVNIHEQPIMWPVGPWPKGSREKLTGRLMLDNVTMAVKPMTTGMFTHFLGWTLEEAREFIPKVEKDLTSKVGRYYGEIRIIYAQRPEEPVS